MLPKRRIMEIYLNIAEWGPNGEFGVEAGRPARLQQVGRATLRAGEAALLAAMLPNPKRRSAQQPRPAVRRIAGIVQARAAAIRADRRLRLRRTVLSSRPGSSLGGRPSSISPASRRS